MTEDELDSVLHRFAHAPTANRLAQLDERVIARMPVGGAGPPTARIALAVAMVALGAGLGAGRLSPAAAAPPGGLEGMTLAPSELLAGLLR